MASPFKVFRKHQKILLALLGVFVMLGFVVLPVLMQGVGMRKRANPRVANTSEYGPLRESELVALRWGRQRANRFLQALGLAVRDAVLTAEGSPQEVQIALLPLEMAFQDLAPVAGLDPTSDEGLAETWLLARRAEDLGLVVDDATIRAFLDEVRQGRVSDQAVRKLLERMNVRVDDLFSVLREQLLALRLRSMFRRSLAGLTPAQRWDYFQRLKREVTIQSIPVPVSDFLDDVPDPDEATLRAFFEEHKYEPDDPTSPEPGFLEPRKVAIEYLKAEYESFFNREREAIPLEEVKQYYEEHKDRYRREELPSLDDEKPPTAEAEPKAGEPEEPAAPEGPAEEERSTEPEPSAEPKPSDDMGQSMDRESSSGEPRPQESEPKLPDTAPAEPPVEGPPEPAETDPAEQPAETEPVEEPAADSTDSPGDASPGGDTSADETSALEVDSPFRLASFLAEDEAVEPGESTEPEAPAAASEGSAEQLPPAENPAPEPTTVEGPSGEPGPAGPPAAPEASAQPPGPETAAAESPSSEEPSPKAPAAEPPAGQTAPDEAPAAAQPEYLALEEVEDPIRRHLARTRANDTIDRVLGDLRNRLSRYHDQLVRYEVDVETKPGDQTLKPPEAPDFDQWAQQHGLVAAKTESADGGRLISALELRKLDIGRSIVGDGVPFVQAALELPANRPEIARDIDGNAYLFWKTGEADPKVPELDDPGVRERVARQWKMIEARDLAIKEAERLAADARKSGQSLEQSFADDPAVAVTESEPFSWLTYGEIPMWMAYGPPRISEVEGIDAPGHDFMRAVSLLKKGEIGTAMNHPRTLIYVVQLTDTKRLPEVLWDLFKSERYGSYYRASDHDQYLAEKAWLEGIKSEAGFAWDPKWKSESTRREAEQ